MPRYDYRCPECEHIQEVWHRIAELDTIEIKCEKCDTKMHQTFIGATSDSFGIVDPARIGRMKAPQDFRNFLSAIKRAHPGCAIKDR